MKKNDIKIKYDSDADVLSMEGAGRTLIDHAKEMGNLVVHFSKKGEPVLVEILEASQAFKHQPASSRQSFRHVLAEA